MAQTITVQYVRRDEDWTVTVSGLGETLNGDASGLIAARDRADQLVEQLAPETAPTVVHLLNGSAYEFTSAYMTARLTRGPEQTDETADTTDEASSSGDEQAEGTQPQENAQEQAGEARPAAASAATPAMPRKELSRTPDTAPRAYAYAG